jgi:hypothetical protein
MIGAPAAWAKMGGLSPVAPMSTLPAAMASSMGGPLENSIHCAGGRPAATSAASTVPRALASSSSPLR